MKFYGRESEIDELRKVREISHRFARFTVVTGRRRIGKTELVRQAFDDRTDPYLHPSQLHVGRFAGPLDNQRWRGTVCRVADGKRCVCA